MEETESVVQSEDEETIEYEIELVSSSSSASISIEAITTSDQREELKAAQAESLSAQKEERRLELDLDGDCDGGAGSKKEVAARRQPIFEALQAEEQWRELEASSVENLETEAAARSPEADVDEREQIATTQGRHIDLAPEVSAANAEAIQQQEPNDNTGPQAAEGADCAHSPATRAATLDSEEASQPQLEPREVQQSARASDCVAGGNDLMQAEQERPPRDLQRTPCAAADRAGPPPHGSAHSGTAANAAPTPSTLERLSAPHQQPVETEDAVSAPLLVGHEVATCPLQTPAECKLVAEIMCTTLGPATTCPTEHVGFQQQVARPAPVAVEVGEALDGSEAEAEGTRQDVCDEEQALAAAEQRPVLAAGAGTFGEQPQAAPELSSGTEQQTAGISVELSPPSRWADAYEAEPFAMQGDIGLARQQADELASPPILVEEEDLEREFDEEPEFESRDVVVKRNRNARADYQLGEELGRGKFGTVFRCTELATGRHLAAKFVNVARKEDRQDFEREVAIMCQLQHRRLLQLYDAYDDGASEMCLVTELVEGGELFERIVDDDFDLTERKAAVFMRQICEGVEYMHARRIVHLDMKPENILCLSRTGNRIKLIDFGLARELTPEEPLRVMFGTPDFAAPEVLTYECVSFATDMWSVGVICYVLLSGLSPFMGDNDLETMANVTRATFDFDDRAFEPISELAKDFIARLLVREPEKRLKPGQCLEHAWLQRGGAPMGQSLGRADSPLQHSPSVTFNGQLLVDSHQAVSACLQAAAEATPQRPRASFGGDSTTSGHAVSLDKRRLKRYVVRRKWHKTVHAIMALGRMGANLKLKLL